MPYCSNCGKPTDPNAKFCSSCGASLNKFINQPDPAQPRYSATSTTLPPPSPYEPPVGQTSQMPQPQNTQVNSEQILGTIILKMPKSFGRWDSYTGVVTSQRLIFAQITTEIMKNAAHQASDKAKAEGKGFFGQWGDQLKSTYSYAARYFSMPPQAILAETPGNFELSNNMIIEIKVNQKLARKDQQFYEFEVQISSTAGKYEYAMNQNNDYINLLKQVYGERVKMPFGYVSKTLHIGV